MHFSLTSVPSSILEPNILLSTLFSKTLSLCSSLNVGDQVSPPNETAGKFVVSYTLMMMFHTSDQKTRGWEFRELSMATGVCQGGTGIL
jgi:hypothetical protein